MREAGYTVASACSKTEAAAKAASDAPAAASAAAAAAAASAAATTAAEAATALLSYGSHLNLCNAFASPEPGGVEASLWAPHTPEGDSAVEVEADLQLALPPLNRLIEPL